MAILGFLAHCAAGTSEQVEAEIGSMEEMTTYGVHQECYVVAVAEADSRDMETVMSRIRHLEGVLTTHITSLTVEDETE